MISIHLMLMLITIESIFTSPITNFNTSHVNVNRIVLNVNFALKGYFNTSHVNVNPAKA